MISLTILGFYSCSDDDSGPEIKKETLTMGADYANDIYYSMKNGIVTTVDRDNWDIAFSVAARSSSILINEGAGVTLKEYPIPAGWQWLDAIDTTGYSSWNQLNNSDVTWEKGAFGQNAIGHPNYGWGVYNTTTHDIEGSALFIIKLVNGNYKQIFIEEKSAMGQSYVVKYADLDGTNQVSETISFGNLTSNFVYYSIVNEAVVVDREPDASTWDLLITKYTDNAQNYNVVGVLQNIGVNAIDMDNVTDLGTILYESANFSENISTIGADWKTFNHVGMTYDLDEDRIFFIQDQNEKVYKLVFTGFDLTTGNITFDLTSL